MANKTLLVAQREYLENVRTKTFWLGILALPILLVISLGAGFVLAKLKETKTYAVLDLGSDGLADRIERAARTPDTPSMLKLMRKSGLPARIEEIKAKYAQAVEPGEDGKDKEIPDEMRRELQRVMLEIPASDFEKLMETAASAGSADKFERVDLAELGIEGKPLAEQQKALRELVEQKKLFAFFEIGANPLKSLEDFRYVSNNVTDSGLRKLYDEAATRIVQKLRIEDAGLDARVARSIQETVRFREQKLAADGAAEDVKTGDKANKWAPVGFVYLLWIAIMTAAQMLLTNTVEEKSNRIIEVLLSSVSPLQLMAGKVWGIAATGMTLVLSWVGCALLGVWLAPKLIPGLDLPLLDIIGDPLYLVSFVGYFLAGYLLYAAILVGLGSVTNSLKEAQNLLQPVFIILIVPLISMMFLVEEPNGMVAKVLSYIPLFTPFTMMNRAGGPPEPYEYVVTSALLLVSIWIAFRAAGKVFRIGVLMTGNPPKLREIVSWLRQS
jgi:ABC-2 type transport system permease protein